MRKIRGFSLKHRVTTLFRRIFRRRCRTSGYCLLDPPETCRTKRISTLINWTRNLETKIKAILSNNRGLGSTRGYLRVGQEPIQGKPVPVPKGHMAVYVGQNDGDFQRILVPVVYFNHPLFGELLREAEEEYGFNQPGGITIPCRVSEFERVQTRIKAAQRQPITSIRSSRRLMG
ncbi:auxin-responsive protein SAUR36-like [Olea europaea var. sylvestris]|uniref:auxin-responsive protein SAUR36-like n=1 Tax=Olea europaea var. sylvestris TaxID=158386 RepID=UPI000C1D3423|nr:auxin-responsive protein SAUR36-like [Olea europaea var. sylvestris]